MLKMIKEDLVSEFTKASQEVYLFAEIDLIRRKEEGKPWPEMNQNYFRAVLTVITGGTCQEANEHAREINETFAQHYQPCRPADYVPIISDYRGDLFADLSRQAATCMLNHVWMRVPSRMKNYVKRKYDVESPNMFIYEARTLPDHQLTPSQREFKRWISKDNVPLNPLDEDVCKLNWVHFHEKLYDVHQFFLEREAQRQRDGLPAEKSKTFTLVPKKAGYTPNFVSIHKSSWTLLRLLPKSTQRRIIDLLMAKFRTVPGQVGDPIVYAILEQRRPPLERARHAFFTADFSKNETLAEALWRLLFNVEPLETINRKFAFIVSTDGYSATVMLQKPKPANFTKRAEADFRYDVPPSVQDLGEFEAVIGIDPGRTYTATAWDGTHTTQVSNKEIRHNGKVRAFQLWEQRLRVREPGYGAALALLPTLKVLTLDQLKTNTATTLANSEFLFNFCAEKPFRKWRFTRQRFLNKAYYQAASKILRDRNQPGRRLRRALVGYGDYSNADGAIRGTPKSGVKRLKRALRSYGATVVMVDEYKTSKTCSSCHHTVEKVFYQGVECHQVVRCQNTDSPCRIYWQRDFNAARNIHNCFLSKLQGQQRPLAMRRAQHAAPF
jgi:hypothetical protein